MNHYHCKTNVKDTLIVKGKLIGYFYIQILWRIFPGIPKRVMTHNLCTMKIYISTTLALLGQFDLNIGQNLYLKVFLYFLFHTECVFHVCFTMLMVHFWTWLNLILYPINTFDDQVSANWCSIKLSVVIVTKHKS